ncbi:MAG: hypothetical protein PHY02_08520 [Phycisphaerae bacterium]|nr:hypothetical protein [Phycisphaerae bacterium]
MKKKLIILVCATIIALPQLGFPQTGVQQEFLSGQKTKYSTKGHPKANGLNISIEYPSNWKSSEGERPHIIQKFTSDASDGLVRMCIIAIKEQPSFMKLFSSDDISQAMFAQETLNELVPEGAIFIKGEPTKYEGQPGAWLIYISQAERAGLRAEMYILQQMFMYSGKLIVLECSVGGLVDSAATVEQEFTRYLPLFQLIGNSIVLHDKWAEPTNVGNNSIMENVLGEYWWITLIISIVLTWGVGLTPPLLIRFAFLRRPISKGWAIGIVVLFWCINIVFFTAIGSKSKTHAALFLVAWASYTILRKGVQKQQAKSENLVA